MSEEKHEFEDLGELLSPDEAAKFVGRTPPMMANWRTRNEGPPYIRVGGKVVYPYKWLRRWLIDNSVCPSGDKCDEQGRGD
jgi:hypothetical protein